MPKRMATTQSTVPPFDFPPRLNSSPITASGIINQLSQPKSGINANNIPKMDNTPKILPNVFIRFVFYYTTKLQSHHAKPCHYHNKTEFKFNELRIIQL